MMYEEIKEVVLVPADLQKKVEDEIKLIVFGASNIVAIETNPQYENAVALRNAIKKTAKDFEDERDSLVRPKNEEVKKINTWFKRPAERLAELDSQIKKLIMAYQTMIEQRRIEAQKAADELARKEREKIEAAAKAQREREEAARRAEEEANARAAAAENEKDRARALAEAQKAKEKAEAASAKAAMKETIAETVVAVKIEPEISKLKGASKFVTYSATVGDKLSAIKYCIESGKLHLVELDIKTLNKMVVAEKENFSFPGVLVTKTESIR